MNIWELDKLILFIAFVIPGFIALKTYALLIPGSPKDTSKQIIDAVAYSCINYAFLIGPITFIENADIRHSSPSLYMLFYVVALLITPVVLVLIWKYLRTKQFFQDHATHPIEKPWDYVFGQRESYWMRITLKNGERIGGLYSDKSFASSAPAEDQIYLEETWVLNSDGSFERPKNQTAGVIVLGSEISYIELMKLYGETTDE